jgi:hypothetical protein
METQGGGLALSRRGHCDDPLGCLPVHDLDQFSLELHREVVWVILAQF